MACLSSNKPVNTAITARPVCAARQCGLLLFLLLIFAWPGFAQPVSVTTTQPDTRQEPALKPLEPPLDAKAMAGRVDDPGPMARAILDNDHAALRRAIEAGADVDAELPGGSHPIILASIYGDVELMKILTAYEVDVTAKDAFGRNAMHYLAMTGDSEKAKFLMIMDADFADEPDRRGITPLYYAYLNDQIHMARFLSDVGRARVNRVDPNGDPLAFLVVSTVDHPEAVQHMLRHQLNVFKRNRQDLSLAEVATLYEHERSASLLKSAYDRILEDYKRKLREEGGL